MNSKQILIITSNRSELSAAVPALSPENCTITGLDSLNYIGFSAFARVIIDCHSISKTLKKVSLGIRDDNETQALWLLLANAGGPEVFFLVDKMERPAKEMQQMGIAYITHSELSRIASTSFSHEEFSSLPLEEKRPATGVLTADDVREMHQKGLTQLPAGAILTSWAAEVAESLNFHRDNHKLHLIFPVKAASKQALTAMRSEFFEIGSKFPNLLFLVNPLFLPIFNNLFPSLQGRTVAPSAHWETHGAFTGETSVSMLADQRCFGALIPAQKPYTDPKNIARLQKLAQKHGLTLFSTFTLASVGTCDIIATNTSDSATIIPLYPAEAMSDELPQSGAIVVNREFLKHFAFRKGN